MASTTEEIENHIESKREQLRSNLHELEERVKSMIDWRQYFRNNPGVGVGLAFGTGLMLAGLLRGPRRRTVERYERPDYRYERSDHLNVPRRHPLPQRAWDTIQSALVAMAAAALSETLARVAAGFKEHLEDRARDGAATGASGNGVQGEGDYRAARRFRRAEERFVQRADIERAARNAAPRSAAEAAEMAEAEMKGQARGKPS
jgi:hypothetical protein